LKIGDANPMVLILGGTAEARALASSLERSGVAVVTALAGRTSTPRLPHGQVRLGGFDGPDGLAAWLAASGVHAVVDATHPFARRISASAQDACRQVEVPLLRLERPGWAEQAGDVWYRVGNVGEAAALVGELGQRAWLTIGRQGVGAFAGVRTCWFLIRCIQSPDPPLPEHHEIVLDRGPYTVDGELALIDHHRIDVLVTKESGGAATEAKLEAARARRLPVIVVRRPPTLGVESVSTVSAAADWALSVLAGGAVRTARPPSR